MNLSLFAVFSLSLTLLVGCATPPGVKQAVASLNDGYDDNLKRMRQYRELVENINVRHRLWTLHAQTRAKLDLALQWATSDPIPIRVDGHPTDEEFAQASGRLLGTNVVKLVNQIRLSGLKERNGGPEEPPIFKAGTSDMTKLAQSLPALVNEITKDVTTEYDRLVTADLSAFDAYETNVKALHQINEVIKRYLDVDVTVKREDVRDIADSIRELAK